MRNYFYLAMAIAAVGLTSCSDDEKGPINDNPLAPIEGYGAYVLTQGNFYNGVEGGLNVIQYDSELALKNVFVAANGRSLGDTPQCGVAYGSKIYIGTSQSNTIEIIDRATCKSLKQMRLAENSTGGKSPWSMVAYRGKVFISMYDGYLARLDTLSLEIDSNVPVGPNPGIIALHRDKIYVPLSDGMNFPNYGNTACVVNPQSMAVEQTFTVGLNPTQFVEADDELFVLCMGDYGDVESQVYKVDQYYDSKHNLQYRVDPICKASVVGEVDDKLAIVHQPWVDGEPHSYYYMYDPDTDQINDWKVEGINYANAIYYDDEADRVLIASYVMNGIYPSYDLPGYVNVYDDRRYSLIRRYDLGSAGPACIFTHTK